MKKTLSILLAIALLIGCLPMAVFADDEPAPKAEPFDYEGDAVSFIKEDGSAFGMLAPQDGSTFYVNGDVVEMHIIPKNTTVYRGFYYGDIDDFDTLKENDVDVVLADGAMDFTVSVKNCGKALPIVPRKTEEKGDGTSADQYYLAIPAAEKLAAKPEPAAEAFDYEGDAVSFIKEDGSAFGMLAPQDGSTFYVNGDVVEMHILPKNTTVYRGFYYGDIDDFDTLKEKDVDVVLADGAMDFTVSVENCGKALPIVPRKTEEKGDGTSADQYYLAIPAAEKLAAKPEPAAEPFDYEGDVVSFIKEDGSAFGMLAPQDGSTFYVNGDVVEMHVIPKNTTVYRGFYYGDIDDFDTLKENEVDVVLAEGAMDFTVSVENCGKALPIVPRKTEEKGDGTSADQYYLAIPAAEKLAQKPSDQPEDPGQTGKDDDEGGSGTVTAKTVELTVDNQVKMFKVVKAELETKGSSSTLYVTLSGTSYEYLFKGNYDEAAETGYKTNKWIQYAEDKEGKYVFAIPVEKDETYIPIVSISQKFVDGYLKNENKITRAFFPRQFTLDAKAKTLLVEDYRFTQDLKVTNRTDFAVKGASLTTVGGPNSNVYGTTLSLELDKAYTRAFVGTAEKAAKATDTVDIAAIPVRWVVTMGDPDSVESLLGETITLAVYNSKDNTWAELKVSINEKNGTITISADEGGAPVSAQTSVAGPNTSAAFRDVKSNDWYEEYAEKAAELGIMAGYAAGKDESGKEVYEFRGAEKTTRAQFCQILYAMEQKLNKKVKDAPSAGFADVAEGAWYEKAINWAVANDIAAGRATGFGVDASVTRQDMAVMVFNYAKANKKVLGDPDLSVLDKYADAADIAEYAKPAMAWLVKLGLMTGRSETSVAPTADSSRAEIAAFMVSVFEYLNK